MSSSSLDAAIHARAEAWEAYGAILDTAAAEGRDLTTTEAAELQRLDAIITRESHTVNSLGQRAAAADRRVRGDNTAPDLRATADDYGDASAFRSYLRTGDDSELRAQGVGTGSAGGYTVPEDFRTKLVETMKHFDAVRRVAEVITTASGSDLPYPTNDDTANVGARVSENTQHTEQDTTFGTKTLSAYTYSSKIIRVSLQLLEDSAFDLESWLRRKQAERIGRIQSLEFTTGTGSSQPQGIVTGATTGITAGAVAAVTYDELVDLQHAIDPAYREDENGLGWMMNDNTWNAIRKLKDADNRPLVEPDAKRGPVRILLGAPVVLNNSMADMGASARSILFGNFRAGYVIRDVKSAEVLRLTERYADFLQHGFLGWLRSDGHVQDSAAYTALAHPAA